MSMEPEKEKLLDADQRQLKGLSTPRERRRPVAIMLVVAMACLVVAFLLNDPLWRVGLSVFGICLFTMASFGILGARRLGEARLSERRRQTALDAAVRDLIRHDNDVAYLTDLDGAIKFANPAAEARFGEIEEGHLTNAFSMVLANPEVVLFRLQSRAMTLGSAKEDVVTRNGNFRMSVVQVGNNAHLWRFSESAATSRDKGRPTDAMTLPMMTVGASDAILYLNEAFRKLLGTRPKSLKDVFSHLPLMSGTRHTIRAVDGPHSVFVAVVEGVAGRREVYALPVQAGAEAAPQRALINAWDAIEDLPVPLLKILGDGEISASNREARQLLGVEDTDGQRLSALLDGLGRPISDWLGEAIEGHGNNDSEFLRGRGTMQETFLQVTLNLSEDEDGRHLIAVLADVTELKTLEAQFVQSQKMQAIGQLAGGVAHDFNNLLTAISGHCDLLLLRHDQGDQDYGDLIQIHQNANRAASLVGQLLAFSRKQNLQPERIDLRDILSDLTHLLNRLVGEKVELVLHHDPDLAAIRADKRQLEQVLMNLVVNARDAMPQGGGIRVVTENLTLTEEWQQDRATVPVGDYVVVKVVDEGHGIPPERLQKIFEPFYTTKRTGEGTGLGLSTVYGIVKQTGGYVFAKSSVNKGTEFQLLFPAYSLPAVTDVVAPVEVIETHSNSGDGVVLLVEDEAPVRAFASRALRLRGYTVLEADCAEMALTMLADPELNVDIFVTDVIMPGKDGPTWVREALEARPATKVVFVSGYAEDAFGDDSAQIPNSVFLPKPFSLNQLTATVQKQLH